MKVFYTYCKENGEVIGITDSEIAPEYSTTLIYNGNFVKPYFDFEENIFYEGASEQELSDSLKKSVPNEITLGKFMTYLSLIGLEQVILDEIELMQDEQSKLVIKTYLKYGGFVERNSNSTLFFQSILQKNDEEVDEIFINANNIIL